MNLSTVRVEGVFVNDECIWVESADAPSDSEGMKVRR